MRLVIKIGGSVIASPLNPELILRYSKVLRSLKDKGHEIIVVVGGGKVAREFISIAEEMGLPDTDRDEIAISVSRLNAKLLAMTLGEYGLREIPSTAEEASRLVRAGRIVVVGGLKPGITTDTVAAMIMESANSDALVKATDQDGVYDKDPRRYSDARKMDRLSYKELRRIVTSKTHEPGIHQIFDLESIGILEKRKAKVMVVNGNDPRNILAALEGRKIGTTVEAE